MSAEHPILFSGPMVLAILHGRKMQTRRVVRYPNRDIGRLCTGDICHRVDGCPYGKEGDRLWVKETFAINDTHAEPSIRLPIYRASTDAKDDDLWTWRPSIFMPRSLSRLMLEVTGVRVERLQDISAEDARDEGLSMLPCVCESCSRTSVMCPAVQSTLVADFAELWEGINGKRAPWASNPWVWVVTFRVLDVKERAA